MWDCHTFQAYLKQIGKYELWSERIYPGMQRAIIGTMLACQENMDRRPNTFGNLFLELSKQVYFPMGDITTGSL